MKSIIISIRPEWVEKIISGEKTVEFRKTIPCEFPFRAYIYCTIGGKTLNIPISDERLRADVAVHGMESMNCPIGNGKVVGEFICHTAPAIHWWESPAEEDLDNGCLTFEKFNRYRGKKDVYGLHISDLVIYEEPKDLCSFVRKCPAYGKDIGKCWECLMAVGEEHDCGTNGRLLVERAPQSWMYAEDQT